MITVYIECANRAKIFEFLLLKLFFWFLFYSLKVRENAYQDLIKSILSDYFKGTFLD